MRRYIITYSRPSSRGGREKELKMNTENAPKTENAQQSNADPVKRVVTLLFFASLFYFCKDK